MSRQAYLADLSDEEWAVNHVVPCAAGWLDYDLSIHALSLLSTSSQHSAELHFGARFVPSNSLRLL